MVHDDAVTAVVFREFLGCLMLGAPEPLRASLDSREAHLLKTPRAVRRRNAVAGHRFTGPHPEVAGAGEAFLLPARMPICHHVTSIFEILAIDA